MNDTQAWTLEAAERMTGMTIFQLSMIALTAVAAILVLWWGTRLARRRRQALEELEARGEVYHGAAPQPPAEPAPLPEEPPVSYPVEPPVAPAPPPLAEGEAPGMPAFADEPIAAAAPLEASPASLAADVEAEPAPEPAPEPASADDLTEMKGVGPRLAERLNSVGITRFAQIAALTPEEAAALDARLGDFQGRLERDRWIEQAAYLARGDREGFQQVFGKL